MRGVWPAVSERITIEAPPTDLSYNPHDVLFPRQSINRQCVFQEGISGWPWNLQVASRCLASSLSNLHHFTQDFKLWRHGEGNTGCVPAKNQVGYDCHPHVRLHSSSATRTMSASLASMSPPFSFSQGLAGAAMPETITTVLYIGLADCARSFDKQPP